MSGLDFSAAVEQVLRPLFAASNVLNILERADRQGLLAALRDGASIGTLARLAGLVDTSAETFARALVVTGIAQLVDGTYRLTAPWQVIAAEGNPVPLAAALSANRAMDRMLLASEADYFSIPAADRLAFARAAAPDPYSSRVVALWREELEDDPLGRSMLGGGRFLELGCGVAGGMLTLLQAVPKMHAVGIELNPELSAEARRRSVELGVSDRVEIVTGDATTFRDKQPFDFGFWSQAFFPAPTREAALRTVFDSVRSGGHITAPVFGRHEVIAVDPGGLEARNYAIWRVMFDGWGVPERTTEELSNEITTAGFVDPSTAARLFATMIVHARRP